MGDPVRLEPGEWVAAVCSPFGFERSITAGIVSAKGRALPDESYAPFIQTDVAVNPGNSGGPLFNLRGEVIGVNSVIYTGSGGYMGLSFAIPIDFAMEVIEQLRARGRVTRGRIGVRLQEMTAELARALRLALPSGALVVEVDRGGSAERAGMRPGDVIVRFDGRPVESNVDMAGLMAHATPGTIVEAGLLRHGVPITLPVLVGRSAAETAPAQPLLPPARDRHGLQLAPLTREQRERLQVASGLLVQHAGGEAQLAGLQRGDVILSANGEPAASVGAFRAFVDKGGEAGVALLVQRGGERLFIPLRAGG